MSYPFPGMNPWLEDPRFWRSIHQRMITGLADLLAPQIEPRYFVDVELHTYVTQSPNIPLQSRYPDVTVIDRGGPAIVTNPQTGTIAPVEIDLPLPEPFEEPYLAIRLLPDGEVITVIELLSHTNKKAGRDRESYLEKREAFLDSDVNFVEIDLLRAAEPMPFTVAGSPTDYRIFIRRRERMRKALLYPFQIRQVIPTFPLPLQPDDDEPLVDLGQLLHDIYDRARYYLIVNYSDKPAPPLTPEDAAWAAQVLRSSAM